METCPRPSRLSCSVYQMVSAAGASPRPGLGSGLGRPRPTGVLFEETYITRDALQATYRMGVRLAWRRFAEIDNVIAIKIAPFNRYQTIDVIRAVAEAENLFSSNGGYAIRFGKLDMRSQIKPKGSPSPSTSSG